MDSVKFQGSATSTPFAPERAYDPTGAMQQQLDKRLQWMREDQNMIIQDRNAYASALGRKQQAGQALRNSNVEALAGLSKTLTDTVLKVQEKRKEDDIESGLMLSYEYGVSLAEQEKFNKDEATLSNVRDATNNLAAKQAKLGAPPEAVEQIRNLSGWKKYGYTIGAAQQAGMDWPDYLDNALQSDAETQVDLGNGQIITPSQANDKAQMAAATTVLRLKFLREKGLYKANAALLNKHLFPNMREGDVRVIGRRHAEMISTQSQATYDEQDGILTTALKSGADPGSAFNNYVTAMASVLDPKTRTPLTLGGARDRGIDLMRALGKSGELNDPDLRKKIESTLVPGSKTETWGGKFGQIWIGLDDDIRSGREADLAASDRQTARQEQEDVKTLVAYAEQKGGLTDIEVEQIRQSYAGRGLELPAEIKRLVTVEKQNDQEAIDYLNGLKLQGKLFVQDVLYGNYSNEVKLRFIDEAKKAEVAFTKNPSFVSNDKALRELLKNTLLLESPPGTRPHWTLPLAEAKASELLRTKTEEGIRDGLSPGAAADVALKSIKDLIEAGKPENGSTGPFRIAGDKAYPKLSDPNPNKAGYLGLFAGAGTLAQAQQKEAEFKRLYHQVAAHRYSGFVDMKLISDADIAQLQKKRTDPSVEFPASIVYLTKEARTLSPWQIADRQLAAAGIAEPLTRPAQVAWSESINDPKLAQLLNTMNSASRTARAYSGLPWNAAKVPNNWGGHIDKAAKKNGLDPSLLAGLLAHESDGWRADAVSSAGAVGLGQIMTVALADAGMTNPNDRLDPVKSIYGAARILSQRIKDFNGNVRLALRGYNMGFAGAQGNPGGYKGDDESINYPDRVLKQAAAYGYGFGQGSPFRRPETMNPRLTYNIDSLGYGSTGPHLDVKPVSPGTLDTNGSLPSIDATTLDQFVFVKGKGGKLVPISRGTTTTDTDAKHRNRGSYGHDFAANKGTGVYVGNGAKVVGTFKGDQGTDHTIIELPDGRRFQFLHGTNS